MAKGFFPAIFFAKTPFCIYICDWNQKTDNMKRLALMFGLALTLTACGGGSGGSSGIPHEPTPAPTPTPTPTPTTVAVTGVSLSKTTLTMEVGDSEQITATVSPNNATDKTVSWKSDNTGVATVDDGKITAVAAGTAVITVTTKDGGKTATCTVTVNPATVAVTGVSLDKTTLKLTVGGSNGKLNATVTPDDATDKSVTWESSDKKVATVKDGVVTPVAEGTATITVKTVDGNKTASCAVTVSAPAPVSTHVTSVALNRGTLQMESGTTEQLTVTVNPKDATDKTVTWTSSNAAVASVDKQGKVTALASGEAVVTVKSNDGGKTATCKITVVAASSNNGEDVSNEGQDW